MSERRAKGADEVWFLCGQGVCEMKREPAGMHACVGAEYRVLAGRYRDEHGEFPDDWEVVLRLLDEAEATVRRQFAEGEAAAVEIEAAAADVARRRLAMRQSLRPST